MCVQDCLGGSGGMLPQKIFKIRKFRLTENEFHTTKFPDFSLTFLVFKVFKNLLIFPGFQVAEHPVLAVAKAQHAMTVGHYPILWFSAGKNVKGGDNKILFFKK